MTSYLMPARRARRRCLSGLTALAAAALLVTAVAPGRSGAAPAASPTPPACGTTTDTEYATGTTAAAIGWAGNDQAVVACLSGSFVVNNTGKLYGFGVYDGSRTTWTNAERFLPALVTGWKHGAATMSITNFGDKITVGGHAFAAVYSRVTVTNTSGRAITVDPQPSAGLVALNPTGNRVAPHATVTHDYVVASDRFAATYAYPTNAQLIAAGGYAKHYAHMAAYWKAR